GCRNHVRNSLEKVDGVREVHVDLEKAEATVEMDKHISIHDFQQALANDGGAYTIHEEHHHSDDHDDHGIHHHDHSTPQNSPKGKGTGVFYCPMHCEGDKTYDEPGSCPICGMDLVEEISLNSVKD